MKRILLSLAHMSGKEEEFIREAFDSNWVVPLGPNVDGFERDLEAWIGKKAGREVHVVALSSGTAAIHLALVMLGVGPGDEVICQSFTFAASANPVCYQGATPVFVDSEPDTWNIDPQLLETAIEDRLRKTGKLPKAIIPVHLYGTPARMNEVMLRVRRNGHGSDKKPVVFPKLVYLYDEKQIAEDPYSSELFDEAVRTSSQCMYPDYLSLSSEYGTVSRLFREQGVITSPMGCRAYLSPWANEEGKYITIGRCNIGAVSLNIPLIIKLTQLDHPENWRTAFWSVLDERLEVIREFFKKRYDIIRHQKCSSNPLAFTQGGFYEGTKDPDDEVGDLVRYMTASFGITALDEATYLWTGKRLLDEGGDFSAEVLRHLQAKINEFKKADGWLYAIYGTPAESLCATQAKQYDAFCRARSTDNVFTHTEHYSPEYFTNSFHVNVTEEITPFEKQDHEFRDFHLCEGGHIQYVRLDNPENIDAVKAVVRRGMEMGFYQGVNFDSAYCNECGAHSTNVLLQCPHCGSRDISVISRVCGYLGYSNVNGISRMNEGKMAEIHNRKSM